MSLVADGWWLVAGDRCWPLFVAGTLVTMGPGQVATDTAHVLTTITTTTISRAGPVQSCAQSGANVRSVGQLHSRLIILMGWSTPFNFPPR